MFIAIKKTSSSSSLSSSLCFTSIDHVRLKQTNMIFQANMARMVHQKLSSPFSEREGDMAQ